MRVRLYLSILILLALSFILYSCNKSEEIDTEKPVIDLSTGGAFPVDCDTLYFGETFLFKARFTDNVELGSTNAYNIDIHHNFDHHSHSTQYVPCDLDPKKNAINPIVYLESFSIPPGVSDYVATMSIQLPKSNSNGDEFEPGDYHFQIKLTDKEGWSTQYGMNVKVLHR